MSERRLPYEFQSILGGWAPGRAQGCAYAEWAGVRVQDRATVRFATPLARRLQP